MEHQNLVFTIKIAVKSNDPRKPPKIVIYWLDERLNLNICIIAIKMTVNNKDNINESDVFKAIKKIVKN